jgi:formate C-acetyltransferase
VIKRAKALRDVLEQMPIYLREGDLIAGTPTSTPGAWIVYPEFSLGTESIVQTRHNFSVGHDFIARHLPEEVREFWRNRSLHAHYAAVRRECFGDSVPPPDSWYMLSTALGHITPDFAEVLHEGLEGVIRKAERHLRDIRDADPEGAGFLRAVVISAQGAISFSCRYAELAEAKARETSAG